MTTKPIWKSLWKAVIENNITRLECIAYLGTYTVLNPNQPKRLK